jgi:mannose-6-phosphate isomerase-like protein (cupin superfamily)
MKKSTLRLRSNHNYAVILAGGVGSRFWPLSRSLEPKQFLSLFTPLETTKDRSEEVKRVVDILKKGKREETYSHKTVKRPWGRYTLLDRAAGFKIKLVEVSPKRALSLQRHSRRSEHWVVVEGRAKVTKGRRVYYVNANESTFIPLSCVHRLENPTNSALKIVEVQSGDYLEEDDIVRIRDDFERV